MAFSGAPAALKAANDAEKRQLTRAVLASYPTDILLTRLSWLFVA
jgi:hypothetical protein